MQTKILDILRSRKFFAAILLLFAIESSWIAISAAYPMVFDENTHFQTIQFYADRINPVILEQPENMEWAGAITRNPSYLFTYLLSFPYRLIATVTDSLMAQVVFLRFINIAFFGASLILFRRLLMKTKVSPAIIHVALLFFVLTPTVPLLAGQINYDNLIMLCAGAGLLLTAIIGETISKQHRIPYTKLFAFLILGMLSSLVQFMYLPIFAGTFLWLAWQLTKTVRRGEIQPIKSLTGSWNRTPAWKKAAIGLPFGIAAGLFIQMYGLNMLYFQNLTPECDQVLTRQECASFAPWQRNQDVLARNLESNPNPVSFLASWTYRLFISLFFTSSGGASPSAFYISVNPMPVVFVAAILVFAAGVGLLLLYRQKAFKEYEFMGLFLFLTLFYALPFWLRTYLAYVDLGEKIAIQGRYILPIMLPAMILLALGFRQMLGHRAHLKMALAMATFVLFLQGGGALTYIASSNKDWYWENRAVAQLNEAAQKVVNPLILVKQPMGAVSLTGATTTVAAPAIKE
jgi:hypothetical protein